MRMVYSPMDSLDIAAEEPDREVVFLGVGFETTAPGTAIAVREARDRGLKNFSVLSLLKRTESALRALIGSPDFQVSGFLCPGHVATIVGADGFDFLSREYGIPSVVGGFEAGDILAAVYRLLRQIKEGVPRLENEYTRAVTPEGNPMARAVMAETFTYRDDVWRGLGTIPDSGYGLRPEFAAFDAERKFPFHPDVYKRQPSDLQGSLSHVWAVRGGIPGHRQPPLPRPAQLLSRLRAPGVLSCLLYTSGHPFLWTPCLRR